MTVLVSIYHVLLHALSNQIAFNEEFKILWKEEDKKIISIVVVVALIIIFDEMKSINCITTTTYFKLENTDLLALL